ncbi:MAG: VCBS repeat-containing protein, partial [bacterium]|nr:VCBS repeat-containing protein [Planctomycetota bacterium]
MRSLRPRSPMLVIVGILWLAWPLPSSAQSGPCAGNGTLEDSGQSLGSLQGVAVALGDLDLDGDLDCFVVTSSNQPNLVYLNDGSGSFFNSGPAIGMINGTSVALGDIDSDGDLDAVVACSAEPNRVYRNLGGLQGGVVGSFSDSGQTLGNSFSYGIELGDLDGDGDLDAFVTNVSSQPNRIYTNDGNGSFSDSGALLGNYDSVSVALGDLDGDGDLDAFIANSGSANRIYLNGGGLQGGTEGAFSDSGQTLGAAISFSVDLGDLDGDGDLDAFVGNTNDQFDRIYLNAGGIQGGTEGFFYDSGQELGAVGVAQSHEVVLGDLDADGDLDAFVANRMNQPNLVYLNDSSGSFTDSGQRLGSSWSLSIALGDLDGDGYLDAFVGNSGGQTDRVYLNDGTGGPDCNQNGIGDPCEIANGLAEDCDQSGIPDSCELNDPNIDCDSNGLIDSCELAAGSAGDCNGNGLTDACDLAAGAADCNFNGLPDSCDIDSGTEFDCDLDGIPDSCKSGPLFDCNGNGIPDECDFNQGTSIDCNQNGILDDCEILNGFALDCDLNGNIDSCDIDDGAPDCNGNGILDVCDLQSGMSLDCNGNQWPDECDIASG